MKKLYLVDVSSMFFRAFYAVRPLTSPAGVPTNAIFGFVSMIVKLMKEEKPDYLAFCYDRPEPSFRIEIDPNYKANRSETPEELIPQIPYIKKIVDAMGIPAFEVKSFEADDLMGTFAHFGSDQKLKVIIVSGDKDFAQLVNDEISLYDTMKDARIDKEGVFAKWGVRPEQFIDYLALVGDSSDNVPGVTGIGPKGTQKLLADYHSLDGIYEHVEEIKSDSLKEKLKSGKANAYLSQKLVTIVRDVPIQFKLEDLTVKGIKRDELRSLLRELNFKSFEKNLLGDESGGDSAAPVTAQGMPSPIAQQKMDSSASSSYPSVAFEYNELPVSEVFVSEIEDRIKYGQSVWVTVNERGVALATSKEILLLRGPAEEWSTYLTARRLRWSGFNLKDFWREWKIEKTICEWDSQLAAYVLKASAIESFEKVVSEILAEVYPTLPTPNEELALQLRLQKRLQEKLEPIDGLKVLQEFELPLSPILLSMEQKGILLDENLLAEQSKILTTDIASLESEIHSTLGETFNIASPKQLSHILFDKVKLPPSKKTKTGFSTDNDVLEKLKGMHPSIELILQYRELTKLKSTYVDSLPLLKSPIDGRIHTHFNQALTSTGRLSSTQPNLQNIPIKTDRGAAVRKAFVAKDGHLLVSIDYSQIELRILAHISSDPGLCNAFKEDLDIHAATASEIFSVPLSQVTSTMRRTAKAVNFGIAYGQGAFGLAETLGISRTESTDIIKRYFLKFAKVRDYMDSTIADAKEKGYVSTLFGRRRIMHELKSSNQMIKKFGERAAINAPIQGSAADIVKLAMLKAFEIKDADLLLQVHDELIFEVREALVEEKMNSLKKIMESVCELKVPLKVNGAFGKNWDEAH